MAEERRRDPLGRPLPHDAPSTADGPPVPEISTASDADVWALALDHIERGLPFHAHELFEQRWRTCPPDERDAWQALAQWGAALTHEARGNAVGARRLADRALQTLDAAAVEPAAIDAGLVRASCRRLSG